MAIYKRGKYFQRSEEKKDLLNEAVSDLEELVDKLDEHQNV